MRTIIFYIWLLILLVISCQSHNEKVGNSSKTKVEPLESASTQEKGQIELLNDSVFNYKCSMKYKDYELAITTSFQCDSVIPQESNFFNPIVLDQNFTLRYKDSILKKITLPIKKIHQYVYGGKLKEMLENVIFKVRLIKLNQGNSVYILEGFGGCNSANCPSFSGMLTLNGEFLAINYRTDKKVILEKGDTKLLLDLTGNIDSKAVLLDELVFHTPTNFCSKIIN